MERLEPGTRDAAAAMHPRYDWERLREIVRCVHAVRCGCGCGPCHLLRGQCGVFNPMKPARRSQTKVLVVRFISCSTC